MTNSIRFIVNRLILALKMCLAQVGQHTNGCAQLAGTQTKVLVYELITLRQKLFAEEFEMEP